ncbi:prolyl oligopeptidase family serine peptidase [Coralloluteibacterium stylophorae]|uniref:S9 family peptidase n=1 Tax=Coralloluteibacterium stylophorae TaxID=1776034 RepID=A0A8J7VT23_9GAMM|nr:prolyl oligopeptidase family serine peptidase [Coralloluteibacterium stylophorae]MBS7458816.1 S9 family peptidase [Coralloluteibacterium stylophorae]
MRTTTLAWLVAGILGGLPLASQAQEASMSTDTDPYLWLEEVEGERALDWVKQRNSESEAVLERAPGFEALRSDLQAILDSDAKIPYVTERGGWYYNFWQDAEHKRGLWRRTTPASYRTQNPEWEVLIDVDALNAAEGEDWVWHGADCLKPDYDRCLIALSHGGSDADVTREFRISTRSWVEDGFQRPAAKGGLTWIDEDRVYVYTDFGDGSMTESGYPRIVKEWTRGTPMSAARTVYEGRTEDMYIAALHDDTTGFERDFVSRTIAFYNDELYLRADDGGLEKIDVPNSAAKGVHKQWLTVEPREDWEVGGTTYRAGSLLAIDFDAFMSGARDFEVLFAPDTRSSLAGTAWTRNHLILNVLEDVKNRLYVLTPAEDGSWARAPLAGAPEIGTVSVDAVDDEESDDYFMTVTDFLHPTALYYGTVGGTAEKLKETPAFFDGEGMAMTQHFATSADGTKVPYFMVAPKGFEADGSNPTLLYGYGGFEISLTPSYSGSVGRGWLSQGGVYVVANIRGGGEYGPRWHQAALKANRNKAYEDFAAVARDLVARKVTSPEHLGIQGGSNGGLLMGNMTVMYPELFGAVVCQVPLLDMKRYNKLLAGASWMAEYGNPDTDDWAFLKQYSPYQNVAKDVDYPPVFFTTSTRDDRVHPGHARKMMARMSEQGHDVTYWENIEGGHGGAADNAQRARMQALAYTFLRQRLFPQD